MITRGRLTAEDLLRMPEGECRRELIHGEIVEMPLTNPLHSRLVARLAYFLEEHIDKHGGGLVFAGDPGFVLNLPYDPERVRGPDLAFVSRERLPEGPLPEKFLKGAPDLAVEVVSPSQSAVGVQEKVRDYFLCGARLVWVLILKTRTTTAYRADGSATLLSEDGILEGEDVLPGFELALKKLFET